LLLPDDGYTMTVRTPRPLTLLDNQAGNILFVMGQNKRMYGKSVNTFPCRIVFRGYDTDGLYRISFERVVDHEKGP